ncbi:MAG: hypothetical protein F6K19_27480 [Cyanothece sp. SIO1E1]|nr:hypothetical protein [Cyanothece sp. SIO1E1]
MKIAFIAQPFDTLLPKPQNSISIWAHELSTRVAQHHEVIIYSAKKNLHDEVTQKDKIKYIAIPSSIIYRGFIEVSKFILFQ